MEWLLNNNQKDTDTSRVYTVEKYVKVESINTQNNYKTTSKKWRDKKNQICSLCFVNIFKFQENKFKIILKNFYEITIILIKKDFLEKPLVTMIITW